MKFYLNKWQIMTMDRVITHDYSIIFYNQILYFPNQILYMTLENTKFVSLVFLREIQENKNNITI